MASFYLSFLKPNSALAQTDSSRSLTAIPPRKGETEPLRGSPGETITTEIRLRNTSNETMTVETFMKDFIVAEDGKTPIPVDISVPNRWSMSAWTTLAPNYHIIEPREIVQLSIKIEIPEDAMPGGHYAMAIHQPTNKTEEQVNGQGGQSGSSVNQQVGTLFYLIVEGPISEVAFIRHFYFRNFQEFGPVPYSFDIENQSDIHIKPQSSIAIFNLFGKQVATLTHEPKNIFPLMSRGFEGEWDTKWGFGLYKAVLTTSYGSSGQIAVASTKFWILPIKLIITILAIILAGIITFIIKRNKKDKPGSPQQPPVNDQQINQNQPAQPQQATPQQQTQTPIRQ